MDKYRARGIKRGFIDARFDACNLAWINEKEVSRRGILVKMTFVRDKMLSYFPSQPGVH